VILDKSLELPTFAAMLKSKAIMLLTIVWMLIFPWRLAEFCVTHPLGHEHHHHDGLSQCELRKIIKETSYWPPMECFKMQVAADDYQVPQRPKLDLSIKTLAVAAVLFELVAELLPQSPFIEPPRPRNTSDPPLKLYPLRGPPLV